MNAKPLRCAILKCIVVLGCLLAAGVGTAGPGDGMVVGVTKLIDNGPASDRYNLVLMGDGYQEAELPLFAEHADQFVKFMFETPPFDQNCTAFNVWRVDVVSNESGADDPASPADNPGTPEDESLLCGGGTGVTATTFFDSTFCADGKIRRLLAADNGVAIDVLNNQLPEWDQALLIVNTTIYGGSGGSVGVTSLAGTWENIAIHEFGHSAFGLADEYEYWAGCGIDTDRDNHPAVEPAQPNVTIETNQALLKWTGLIDPPATPLPTTANADCSICDPTPDPFPGDQVVGLYEGAHYYHCDSFRPVFSCMMRNFSPFCPVCTQRILATLEPFQPPGGPSACGPGLVKCYFGKQNPPFTEDNQRLPFPTIDRVTLNDQFTTSRETDVRFLQGLCNPAGKNAPVNTERKDHLSCYSISDAPGQPLFFPGLIGEIQIETENFGEDTVKLGHALELCVSANKNGEFADIGDFKCYSARSAQRDFPEITLDDQFNVFENESRAIRRLSRFCTPVGKDTPVPASDPETFDHLACYELPSRRLQPQIEVDLTDMIITNALGQNITFTAEFERRFCEPARKISVQQ